MLKCGVYGFLSNSRKCYLPQPPSSVSNKCMVLAPPQHYRRHSHSTAWCPRLWCCLACLKVDPKPKMLTTAQLKYSVHTTLASLRLHRWLGSMTVACPRLLALPRHQLFRLFRDWAAGRVETGEAAGKMNERAACMFRGVGEIMWKEVGPGCLERPTGWTNPLTQRSSFLEQS